MLHLVVAASVCAVVTVVYGAIGLRWHRRARIRRAALALVAGAELEPYHAAAIVDGATGAAAAELLLGGYLDIGGEGAVRLTEAGRDAERAPGHPLPAALLDALRRHGPEPVPIGWIDRYDEEYGARRSAYRRARDAVLPEIPRLPDHEGGQLRACCACVGVLLLMQFWVLAAALLLAARPRGVLEWAAAAVAAVGLAALCLTDRAGKAVRARTAYGDPLGDRIRAASHPALAALDERRRDLVRRSLDDHGGWRGGDRIVHEGGDGGEAGDGTAGHGVDDDWWADAYHYRAADHMDGPGAGGARTLPEALPSEGRTGGDP